jgi:hypothetical protein
MSGKQRITGASGMKSDPSQKAQREFFEHQGEGPWTVIYDSYLRAAAATTGSTAHCPIQTGAIMP